MSLFLAGLLFMAAFVFICLSGIWVFSSAIKGRVEPKFRAADAIVNDHRVPDAWLKASQVRHGTEDRAKALCIRNLDELIGFFRTCPFVEGEESREVLLHELQATWAAWKNWTWAEIRAWGVDKAL